MAIFQYNPARPLESPPKLHLLFWGKEDCVPGHAVGPGVRDVYKIHFIHRGKGIVRTAAHTYVLAAGQAFLIYPGVVYYYEADKIEPWTYSWIGFQGTDIPDLLSRTPITAAEPVFMMDNKLMPVLYEQLSAAAGSAVFDLRLMALFYDFLAAWLDTNGAAASTASRSGRQEEYVHQTLEFLHSHYGEDISISVHADKLGLNRKYLSAIFKKALDIPPREYLLHYRIEKACEMLLAERLTIGEISRSVGYQDPLLFSRMFRKVKGIPPKKYREEHRKSDNNP